MTTVPSNMNLAQARVIDPILTNIALGYKMPNLVGSSLFPRVPVMVSGGQVLTFGPESFKLYASTRSPGAATKRITFGYLGTQFALVNKALEAPVPREYLRDAAEVPGIDLATRAVKVVLNSLLLDLENDQATVATNANNYGTNNKVALSGTSKWSNAASTPIQSMLGYRENVRQSVGIYPNVALFSAVAWNAFVTNPNVISRFQYTSHESITPAMIANLIQVDRVVIGQAIYFDDQGNSYDVWGNNAVLAYAPEDPMGPEEPSYGYTYTMTGHPLVEMPYWEGNAKSWIYGVGFERAPVASGFASGFLIQTPN